MSSQSKEDSTQIVVPLEGVSDGNEDFWPEEGITRYETADPTTWCHGLAMMWMRDIGVLGEIGANVNVTATNFRPPNGLTYTIPSLPEGYLLCDRPRGGDPKAPRDKFLFGHPSGKYYQSRVRFYPHFFALMTDTLANCPCDLCGKAKTPDTRPQTQTRNMVPARARQARDRSVPTDVDVFRVAIANMKTKAPETIDELIEERMNMDWRFTKDRLAEYFEILTLHPAFLPRHGETVLWTPSPLKPGEYLQFNPDTEALMVRNDKGEWIREPKWFAGIITQTPLEEILCQEIITPEDREPGNSASNKGFKDLTSALFRVEALPHPIEDDKSDSLFYKYLPLSCIKPFGFWQCFLHNIPRDKWDPSIENAMMTMSSWSVVSRYRFKGTWPNASIFCQGIWIGAELLAVGDRVRLRPLSRDGFNLSQVTDVMVIETIEVHLKNCIDDPDNEQLAGQYSARIKGKIYSLGKNRPDNAVFGNIPLQSMSMEEVATALNLNIMNKYGHWYRVAEGKTAVVSQDMILGRCYEPDAHLFHWGNHNLGNDLSAILAGRDYSRIADARMPERSTWFWGDYRAETLGLESVNGYDVGVAAEQRRDPNLDVEYDPNHPIHMRPWLAVFRILDGKATPTDARDARLPRKRGRPFKKDSDLQKLGKTSKLISTGLGQVSNDDDEEEEDAKEEEKDEMEIKEEKKVKSESGKRQRFNGQHTVSGNGPGNAISIDSEEESEAESSSSEENDPFGGQPQPLYFCGGTEETGLGDYHPGNGGAPTGLFSS